MKKVSFAVGAIVIAGLITLSILQHKSAVRLRQQIAIKQQELDQLAAANDRLSSGVPQLSTTSVPREAISVELLRLRGEVSVLRKLTNAPKPVYYISVGEDISVTFDPTTWRPRTPIIGPDYQSVIWIIQQPDWIQITVANHVDAKTVTEYKKERLEEQLVRNDPADLTGERHETWGGREWFVLEFDNPNTRPPRTEISYFLQRDKGYVTISVVSERTTMLAQRTAIETFLNQIRVGDARTGGGDG